MNRQTHSFSPLARRKQIILWSVIFVFLFSFLLLPSFVRAECLAMDANGNCVEYGGFLDELSDGCMNKGNCDLSDIENGFVALTKLLIGAIGALALVYFVWGGVQWLTSYGNQQKIQKGREIMLQTVVALIVAFSSYLLVTFFTENVLKGQPMNLPNSATNSTNSNVSDTNTCCVNYNDGDPICEVSVNNTCSNNFQNFGQGDCSNIDMCNPAWFQSDIGCCISNAGQSICEDMSGGGICDNFSAVSCELIEACGCDGETCLE